MLHKIVEIVMYNKKKEETPIVFSVPEVRAVLAGTKTQVRRPLEPFLCLGPGPSGEPDWPHAFPEDGRPIPPHLRSPFDTKPIPCPYGASRSLLWVKEAWRKLATGVAYEATSPFASETHRDDRIKWKSPEFMMREQGRIVLEIEAVRVERLQSITEDGAISEGVQPYYRKGASNDPGCTVSARARYARLWDQLNGERASWGSNPFVWVLTFKMIEI